MAKKKPKPQSQLEWKVVFYVTPLGRTPALDWLNGLPRERRQQLLGWAEAIRRWAPGPYAFPPGLQWQPMRDDAAGCFEIREQHDKILYRLFCIVDRKALDHGLANPVFCLLDGATKPINAVLPKATYRRIGEMREEYLATDRRRVR
ncbi:MAG TPA: hypothetical protein VGR85_02790 [Candidatus Limnocylindria bacterium]|jgi:hypothetical protein|nr:hypothetical protein [Candidatus Limnocylindria bacterium]